MNTIFKFNESPVTFSKDECVMVNATEMAKPFGKRPNDWMLLPSTKEFLEVLTITRKSGNSDYQAVVTKAGTPQFGGGTWLAKDAAIEFARWLSPEFAIWCNDKIEELLTKGSVSLNTPSYQISDPIARAKAWIKEEEERQRLLAENVEMAPKAEYHDKVLSTEGSFPIGVIAKELGTTAVKLNQELADMGIQYKQGKQWFLKAKYQDKGYVTTGTTVVDTDTNSFTVHRTLWTEEGRKFIHGLFANSK